MTVIELRKLLRSCSEGLPVILAIGEVECEDFTVGYGIDSTDGSGAVVLEGNPTEG